MCSHSDGMQLLAVILSYDAAESMSIEDTLFMGVFE